MTRLSFLENMRAIEWISAMFQAGEGLRALDHSSYQSCSYLGEGGPLAGWTGLVITPAIDSTKSQV